MIVKLLFRFLKLSLLIVGFFFAFTFISSPTAQAAPDFNCKKSDASYWNGAINMPASVPTWIKGCFKRITIDQGWTGTVSFMYLSPETNDLSTGNKEATLNAVYYYRGTTGVNYAGMCLAVTSTSNSDGQSNIMSVPDVGFGFSVPCSGWLGHDQSKLTSSTVTLYASKFNAGSNKTATFNYRMAADFSNNSDGTNKSGLWCYDFANAVPAPTVDPPDPPWKTPPCVADGANYTFVNIIKTPPTYDGTISIAKYREGGTLGQFPVNPSIINSATVGLDHSPPDSWSPTKTSNPGNFNNIWVNPNNHNSNTKGNYRAFVNVPNGWRVVSATNRGSNATLNGTCSSGGKCSVHGVTVDDDGTTYVDFFFAPDIRGSLDDVCPKPNQNGTPVDRNGKIRGWVIDYFYQQNANNKAITPSSVEVNIDGSTYEVDIVADKERPDLPINTSNPQVGKWHGFEMDMPSQFFDGQNHTVRIYPLRGGAGIGSPPYTLATREFNCGGPRGSLDVADCTVDNSRGKLAGWGFDPRRPGQAPNLHFYFDSTPDNTSDPDAIYNRNNVVGNSLRPDVVTYLRQNGYPGVLDATKYGFDEPFPDGLHDGESHVVRVYLITESGANPLIGSAGIGGGNSSALVCEAWYHPWLQTQNGDVTASGKVIGQGSGTDLLGSRPPANNEKEAEYLILSVLGGGDRFCSTYRYILTNTDALGGSCANGSGYTSLNRYELTPEPGKDAVVEAITKAFNDNGAGVGGANDKCAPYNTFTALPASPIDTVTGTSNNCLNGTIYKLPASAPTGNFGGFNILAGRMTIFIDGPLNITNDIKYNYISYANPKAVPNLAIIVKGDVNIGPNVTQLDAAVYATGKINTCTGYNPGTPTSSSVCNNRLVVNGMLVGKEGFSFGRSYYNQSARNSAEFISLTGQTIAFPPPGLDSSYFGDFDNSVQIDSGEFQPRF